MKISLRQILADSHVAAVAIALLLLWSLDGLVDALWVPLSRAIEFLVTAVAILDVPYFSRILTTADRLNLLVVGGYLYSALASFFAAWVLSHWVYGAGPLRSLISYGKTNRRGHV